jgi:replicative DNA helicase
MKITTNMYQVEAEQSLLGMLIVNGSEFVNVADSLHSDDFYLPKHQVLYQIMSKLFERNDPIDITTIHSCGSDDGKLDVIGGTSYLSQLVEMQGFIDNLEAYMNIIANKSKIRMVANKLHDSLATLSDGNGSSEELLDFAEKKVASILQSSGKHTYLQYGDGLSELCANIEKNKGSQQKLGIKSGYKDIDFLLAGFQPGNLIIIAARPGMGKTALALNFAYNIAQKNIPIGFFSLEMTAPSVCARLLCMHVGIPTQRLRSDLITQYELERIEVVSTLDGKLPIFIDDSDSLSIMDLRAKARRMKIREDIKILFVDYLQLMHGTNPTYREQEVAEISRGLKALAKELKIPIVALSQLNRGIELRQEKRPILSDLRESGAIEQDADIVMFIHHPGNYSSDTVNKSTTEVIIRKHRDGPLGTALLTFNMATTVFVNHTEYFTT